MFSQGPLCRGHLLAVSQPRRRTTWIFLSWLLFASSGRAAEPAPRHPEPENQQLGTNELIRHSEWQAAELRQRWLWTVLGGALAGTAYFVTRSRRSRDELQKQTDFLQSILDSMAEGVCFQGADGRILATNPAAERIEGRSHAEMAGRTSDDPLRDAVREDGTPFPGGEHPAMVTLRTGRPQKDVIMGIRRPDGSPKWISINSEPLVATGGKPYAVVTTFHDITAQRQAESALKNVLRNARTIVMHFLVHAPAGWEGCSVEWAAANFTWEAQMFDEVTAQEVLPLEVPPDQRYDFGWRKGKHPDDLVPMGLTAHRAILSGASLWRQEFRVIDRHGRLHWMSQVASVEPAGPGRWRITTTNTDITERKLAETALHAREEEFRALVEHAPDAICRFDRDCRLMYTNPAYDRLLGVPADRLLGRTPRETHPGHPGVDDYERKIGQVIATGTALEYEAVLGALPGQHRSSYNIRLVPEHDRAGQVASVLCIGRDITVLKETERQLRTLVEHSPDIILRFDRAGCYRFVNHAMEKVTGIPAAEFIGRPVGEIAARRHGPAVAEKFGLLGQAVGRVFATGQTAEEEMRLPMPAGELIFNVRLIPEADETGQVASVLTLAREITARQRAEEALHSSEQRFRQVTENIDEVFWLTDPAKNEMIYISPAYQRVWGRTCASLYAQPRSWLEAVHSDDRARVHSAALTLQASGGYNLEYRIVRPDETVRWIHDRAFPIKDANGQVYRIAGVAEDITAKHQLEDQLRQTQKMESLGTLAGGIAHDFNNILTGVLGSAEVARLKLAPDHPVMPWIHNITLAGNRARDLVKQILTFGRKHESELAPRKLQLVLAEALHLLRSTIPSMVQIEPRIDDACPPVIADDTQIHQVVMNLCTNAWHALPEHGGRIEIGLAPVQVTSAMAATHLGLAAGPHVLLTVRDNGHGMAPGVLARIFEPFFTTKQHGQGTGLGLAVVHGIVQSHHGAIFAQSTPGQGTLFEIFLPAMVVGSEDGLPPSAEEPLARGHGEQILLVDDDPTALAGLRAQLEYLGYRVTALAGSHVALGHFLAAPAEVDLIMTDYAMPDYTGHELIAKVLAARPGFPVILTSGFVDPGQTEKMRTLGVRDFVRKPIPLPDLARMLSRHLRPAQSR